jgi:hypothetical protein
LLLEVFAFFIYYYFLFGLVVLIIIIIISRHFSCLSLAFFYSFLTQFEDFWLLFIIIHLQRSF